MKYKTQKYVDFSVLQTWNAFVASLLERQESGSKPEIPKESVNPLKNIFNGDTEPPFEDCYFDRLEQKGKKRNKREGFFGDINDTKKIDQNKKPVEMVEK